MAEKRSTGGIGIMGALGLLFIGLKLGKVIDWDWIWVLAPFWSVFAAIAVLLVLAGIAALIKAVYSK